jgi:CRP-like cAMP-binding protein
MVRPQAVVRNRLLAALPAGELEEILPALDVVSLKLKEFLHKQGDTAEYVYFPGNGFASVVTVLENGEMVEVATIGREGAIGMTAVLEGQPVPFASMVQGEIETCHRMTAADFRQEMDRRRHFYRLLTRYSQAFVGFVMQSTGCNALHTVEQRLARWLLMAQDRMEATDFPMTQEFMAMMLGVSRPTVTVVAGTLQKDGLITYHRGRIVIIDRQKLESASCECYRTTVKLLDAVVDGAGRR